MRFYQSEAVLCKHKQCESTYHDEPGYSRLLITDEKAHSGSYSAIVENASLNDARFITTAAVKPNRYYRLSGYVLVDSMGEEGNGANFGLDDIASSSVGLYDTNGEWQYLEWYGKTGPGQRSLTFGVRVGGFGGESIGRAYFDDISRFYARIFGKFFRRNETGMFAANADNDFGVFNNHNGCLNFFTVSYIFGFFVSERLFQHFLKAEFFVFTHGL
jgi:hypothetical protein